jgi:uncharacterized protein (DUF305 family)
MTRSDFLRALGLLALVPAAARAQEADHGDMQMAPMGEAPPATEGYMAANDRMHAAMAIEYSGNPDIDFARSMIPHHQGAIDMARVVLEHGQDAEIRALAEEIIAAQEAEIAFLEEWLAANDT